MLPRTQTQTHPHFLYDIVECRLHILTVVEVHLMHNSESLMALILLLEFYQSQKSIMVSKMSFHNFLLYLGLSLPLNLNSYLILFSFSFFMLSYAACKGS